MLNIFRTLIYPSSGVCDYSVELPHWSYCSWFDVCWSFGVVGLEWYPCWRPKPATRIPLQPNYTTNVVIQQNSRKLLMMDILISEKYWAHKKWNKIASDIKLVFYSSTITMMHGPTNISCHVITRLASQSIGWRSPLSEPVSSLDRLSWDLRTGEEFPYQLHENYCTNIMNWETHLLCVLLIWKSGVNYTINCWTMSVLK